MLDHEWTEPTRTTETEVAYRRRFASFLERAAAEVGRSQTQLEPDELVDWLKRMSAELKPASFRQYRAALRLGLSERWGAEADESILRLTSLSPSDGRRSVRTSGRKMKSVPPARLKILVATLLRSGSSYGRATAVWLVAGVIVGLRPCEWPEAKLAQTQDGMVLHIRNAKTTNYRGNGKLRTLDLSALPPEAVGVVADHLQQVQEAFKKGRWSAFRAGCAKELQKANRTLWPRAVKRITLYSTRHQFAANSKAAELDLATIAALMGHASAETASTHYGRRRSGRGFILGRLAAVVPRASPAQVAGVRPARIRWEHTAMSPRL